MITSHAIAAVEGLAAGTAFLFRPEPPCAEGTAMQELASGERMGPEIVASQPLPPAEPAGPSLLRGRGWPRISAPTLSLDEAFEAERRRLKALSEAPATEASGTGALLRVASQPCTGKCSTGPLSRTEPMGEIFAAHLEILEDPMLRETVDDHVAEGMDPVEAVDAAAEELAALFATIDDEYLRARADDVRDVCRGLRNRLAGAPENPWEGLPEDAVIVAEQLFPSDTAAMDFSKVRAFVTRKGSVTSHVAIIARSKGIPALLGVDIDAIGEGDFLLVDGDGKRLGINPSDAERKAFLERMESREANGAETLRKPDGTPVRIYGNAGTPEEIAAVLEAGAEGIGLFRTEFLFMETDHLPTEEEQFRTYREAVALCQGKPLTVRTLDIGGDKALPYLDLPREENPFLGVRGIRLCLARPDLFRAQLRAILRAAALGPVRLMVPMVTTGAELREVRDHLRACSEQLGKEGLAHDPELPVGIMVETPAAVLTAGELAREADFFSIGTNDLTQYVMAADRGNPALAHLNDPMGDAVKSAVRLTVEAAREAGIPVGICGEMASSAAARQWLAETGIDSLSLSSPLQIRRLKQ